MPDEQGPSMAESSFSVSHKPSKNPTVRVYSPEARQRITDGVKRSNQERRDRHQTLVLGAFDKGFFPRLTELEQRILLDEYVSRNPTDEFLSQTQLAIRYGVSQNAISKHEQKGLQKLERLMAGGLAATKPVAMIIEILDGDVEKLRAMTTRYGDKEVGRQLGGFSRENVMAARRKLEIEGVYGRKNTQKAAAMDLLRSESTYPELRLIELMGQMKDADLAEYLGVTTAVARDLIRNMGTITDKRIKQEVGTGASPEDVFIKTFARTGKTSDEIADILGRSRYEVEEEMISMGIPLDLKEREYYYNDLESDRK
jgi:hypothetical protein